MNIITKIKIFISKMKMIKWVKKHPNQIPIIKENKDGDYKII